MKLILVLLLYRTLLPVLFITAFPGWILKMIRRGGFGTGLPERVGIYTETAEFEPSGAVHIHAVSVGETNIALKLLRAWQKQHPKERFVLATGTSTGHDVATKATLPNVRVTYSPLDFPWMIRLYLNRFEPSRIILIEGDIWPNFLRITNRRRIPVFLANARVSPRSARRFSKFADLLRPFFSLLSGVCIQDDENRSLWETLGIAPEKIHLTGSIKFDHQSTNPPARRKDFADMLEAFGSNRRIILAASTFPGEEELLASAIQAAGPEFLPVLVPRHAERRSEVIQNLTAAGFQVTLRSQFQEASSPNSVFVIDTTGELATWTSHADVVLIGKSFIAKGGQNPAEAILANKPLIIGPHMENFQALVSELLIGKAVLRAETMEEITSAILEAVNPLTNSSLTENASQVLAFHEGATNRHLKVLQAQYKHA